MAFDRSAPGRRGRLCVYLILSYPAAVPWAIAAAVAFWQAAQHRSLGVAWLILIAASAFFLAANLLHRH